MIYMFIDEHRAVYPVSRLCQVLGVASSGYYAWRKRLPSQRAQSDQILMVRIRAIHHRSRQTCGSPRIQAELVAQGERVNHKRVERLTRTCFAVGAGVQQNGLQARHKRRYQMITTQADASLPIAPNRLGQTFQTTRLNQTWLSDITYVPTAEGW